jgi:endonuclease III
MKTNTQKFLNTYNLIGQNENNEVIGRTERLVQEKLMTKLNSDLIKFGSKVTEDQMEYLGDLCLNDFSEFQDAYQN